jgi:hypothetical protein
MPSAIKAIHNLISEIKRELIKWQVEAFISLINEIQNAKPWNPGTVKPWNPGTLEPWNPGTLEPWNYVISIASP